MKSLIEELKKKFDITELSREESKDVKVSQIETEYVDSHDKAIKALIDILNDKYIKGIVLPYMPSPSVLHYNGKCKGILYYVSVELFPLNEIKNMKALNKAYDKASKLDGWIY